MFLGYFWIVGPTIAVTIVWLYLERVDVVAGGPTRIPYWTYVLVGTVLWACMVEALNMPVQQLANASTLLSKVNFPPEALQLAGIATVAINSILRLVLLLPVIALGGVSPSWSVLQAPIGVAVLLMFGYSIGMILAPIGALYRDVGQAMNIAISFLFLVTPVAYSLNQSSTHAAIARLNPIAPLLNTARDWLTGGPAMPPLSWFIVVGAAMVTMVLGWIFMRLAVPHLVDRISV